MPEAMSIGYRNSIARLYFYITPLFIFVDYFWGVSVRVSALDSWPLYKNLYYGFCILCGVCMYIIPRYSAVVALFESMINFMMLVLSIFLQYIQTITNLMDDALGADFKAMEDSLTAESMTNLAIVGFCLILTFRTSIDTIRISFKFNQSDTN